LLSPGERSVAIHLASDDQDAMTTQWRRIPRFIALP